jgi:beta-galactosidase
MKSICYILTIIVLTNGCLIINKNEAKKIPLNGWWNLTKTTNSITIPEVFEYKIQIPSLIDMAVPSLCSEESTDTLESYYWFRKQIVLDHSDYSVVELEIKKAQYGKRVFINGKEVLKHSIIYSACKTNIKPYLNVNSDTNEIVIQIGEKRSLTDTVIRGDDFEKIKFIPGIFDDVNLYLKNPPIIENVQIAPDKGLKSFTTQIAISGVSENKNKLEYVVREYQTKKIINSGKLRFSKPLKSDTTILCNISMPDCKLWSPEDPFLYELEIKTKTDKSLTRFGMRSFSFDTISGKALLNGNRYFLRGSNIALYRFFEDSLRDSLPWNENWVRNLFKALKSMNWNIIRFHIGPAPDFWYDIADETGILIQDEYGIWYGKGGFGEPSRPKITSDQLANEYKLWMRERWNHPSIVIWDAQNETVTKITGEAINKVRCIDLSDRPWDNGYSAPASKTDVIEAHPYLFHDFHFENVKEPKEGIMKYLLSVEHRPANDPNEQDPAPDGSYYNNPVIINEYGWLWVNRDGSPTSLSKNVYKNVFKEVDTPQDYIETYARTVAALTEYWRAHDHIAGIMHFAALTYSRTNPPGQTSDPIIDITKPEFNPVFIKYVRPAFSPLALMPDIWDKYLPPAKEIELKVFVINDNNSDWNGYLNLSIYQGENEINIVSQPVSVTKNSIKQEIISFITPGKSGNYELRAWTHFQNEKIISYRKFNIGE